MGQIDVMGKKIQQKNSVHVWKSLDNQLEFGLGFPIFK